MKKPTKKLSPAKKKNPQDATLRNIRALRKKLAAIEHGLSFTFGRIVRDIGELRQEIAGLKEKQVHEVVLKAGKEK